MPMDRRRYPTDWPAISRAARERAGWRCEQCGAPHGELVVRDRRDPAAWRPFDCYADADSDDAGLRVVRIVLTVAHLDHDPRNCDPANLRAWCQRCHLAYDAELHRRNAAATRRRKRLAAGQLGLEVAA